VSFETPFELNIKYDFNSPDFIKINFIKQKQRGRFQNHSIPEKTYAGKLPNRKSQTLRFIITMFYGTYTIHIP